MKILIYSTGRSGSGNLCKLLSENLNYKKIDEPFNKKLWRNNEYQLNNLYENNIVCKCLIDDWDYDGSGIKNVNQLFSLFDKVIILTRENTQEQAESLVLALNKKRWNHKYFIDESFLFKNKKNINNFINSIKKQNLKLNGLNGLKVTYEGIYFKKTDIQKIEKYIEFKINDLSILNIENKFRTYNKQNVL